MWARLYNLAPGPVRLVLLAAPRGRRVYVRGLRLHHGLIGALMAGLGLGLAVHDRRDWPWPLRDRS